MDKISFLEAMTIAILNAWGKGYYQGLQDGASQPSTPQVRDIINISCSVAGITLSETSVSCPTVRESKFKP